MKVVAVHVLLVFYSVKCTAPYIGDILSVIQNKLKRCRKPDEEEGIDDDDKHSKKKKLQNPNATVNDLEEKRKKDGADEEERRQQDERKRKRKQEQAEERRKQEEMKRKQNEENERKRKEERERKRRQQAEIESKRRKQKLQKLREDIEKSKEPGCWKYNSQPMGLPNLGNTCYMNSILQVLSWTPLLGQQLAEQLWKSVKNENIETDFRNNVQTRLFLLLLNVHSENKSSVTLDFSIPNDILKEARKLNDQFMGYRQQDSFEMYNTLIGGAEDEARALPCNYAGEKSMTDNEVLMRKSNVSRLLGGTFMTVWYYESCEHVELTFQRFTSVSAPVPKPKPKPRQSINNKRKSPEPADDIADEARDDHSGDNSEIGNNQDIDELRPPKKIYVENIDVEGQDNANSSLELSGENNIFGKGNSSTSTDMAMQNERKKKKKKKKKGKQKKPGKKVDMNGSSCSTLQDETGLNSTSEISAIKKNSTPEIFPKGQSSTPEIYADGNRSTRETSANANSTAPGISVKGHSNTPEISANGHSTTSDISENGHSSTPEINASHSSAPDKSVKGHSNTPEMSANGHSSTLETSTNGHSSTPEISENGHSSTPEITASGHSSTLETCTNGHSSTPDIAASGHSSTPALSEDGSRGTLETSANEHTSTHETSANGQSKTHETYANEHSSTPETFANEHSSSTDISANEHSNTSDISANEHSSTLETSANKHTSTLQISANEHSSTPEKSANGHSSTLETSTNWHSSTPEVAASGHSSTSDISANEESRTHETSANENSSTLETSANENSSSTDISANDHSSTSDISANENSSTFETSANENSSTPETFANEHTSTLQISANGHSSTPETFASDHCRSTDISANEHSTSSDISANENSSPPETSANVYSITSEIYATGQSSATEISANANNNTPAISADGLYCTMHDDMKSHPKTLMDNDDNYERVTRDHAGFTTTAGLHFNENIDPSYQDSIHSQTPRLISPQNDTESEIMDWTQTDQALDIKADMAGCADRQQTRTREEDEDMDWIPTNKAHDNIGDEACSSDRDIAKNYRPQTQPEFSVEENAPPEELIENGRRNYIETPRISTENEQPPTNAGDREYPKSNEELDFEIHRLSQDDIELRKEDQKNKILPHQPLEVMREDPTDLERGLFELTEEEIWDEEMIGCRICNSSNTHGKQTHKKLLIIGLPPVFVVHINKIEKDGYGGLRKINKTVTYPKYLNVAPFCSSALLKTQAGGTPRTWFRLYGVVSHGGSIHGGHYTAYVRATPQNASALYSNFLQTKWMDPERVEEDIKKFWQNSTHSHNMSPTNSPQDDDRETWYYVSDTMVQQSDEHSAANDGNAYILMYERCC